MPIFLAHIKAMCGVGKVNVAPRDAFPPFPSHCVPSQPNITAMFVKDCGQSSATTLAVDHQRKVVKHTLGGSWWADVHDMW